MAYRDTASYGKRQEFKAISKLLELGFDVYNTLVDDMGIDCIIRINSTRYLDIQIKARSKECLLKNRGYFPALTIIDKSENYFFILYSEFIDTYWVIPSNEILAMAEVKGTNINMNRNGQNAGKFSVRVAGANCNPFDRFNRFKNANGFRLLA